MLTTYLRLCEYSYDSILAKPGGIVTVNNDRTGENGPNRVRLKGYRVLLPMNKIRRSSMRPVHRSPSGTKGVMLVIEMPKLRSFVVEHTVRIIHPKLRR